MFVPRSRHLRQDDGVKAMAVHHVSINVRDVDQAEQFYIGRLGLVRRKDRPDFGFPGAWLDAGGQQVHLIQGEPPAAVGQHFALRVDDLDAAISELRSHGVDVSDAVVVGTGRQAFLNDPSGNGVELHEVAAG
jgi:catechol 2,3-dioxygenase-like lactoylglutathione lyase family enzyme